MLEGLLMLGGQPLLYSGLDVEQIGAVYETMMGFTVELTDGPSLAITSGKSRLSSTSRRCSLSRPLDVPPG
jgi:hypothetical protein